MKNIYFFLIIMLKLQRNQKLKEEKKLFLLNFEKILIIFLYLLSSFQTPIKNFMKKYLSKKTKDIINEIDRYIFDPGQALCYVIGKLEIIKMRDKYLKENKTKTIKDFHEKLLINGTCSLSTIKKLL